MRNEISYIVHIYMKYESPCKILSYDFSQNIYLQNTCNDIVYYFWKPAHTRLCARWDISSTIRNLNINVQQHTDENKRFHCGKKMSQGVAFLSRKARHILRNRKSRWQVIIGVASNRHWLMANIRAFPTGTRVYQSNKSASIMSSVVSCREKRRSFSRMNGIYF